VPTRLFGVFENKSGAKFKISKSKSVVLVGVCLFASSLRCFVWISLLLLVLVVVILSNRLLFFF